MESSMEVPPKKLKREFLYDSAIPLLGIYLDEKITCTPVLTAALFTRAKTWKQPKCPSTNEKDVVHTYNGVLLSPEWNNAICSNMDGPRDDHTKWSQTKTNMLSHVESKIGHNGTYLWNRLTERTDSGCQGGDGGRGGMEWECGVSRCKQVYIEWMNKVLLYSTGNSISPDKPLWKRIWKRVCVCVYNWTSLLYSRN